jgi:hypothetical protein
MTTETRAGAIRAIEDRVPQRPTRGLDGFPPVRIVAGHAFELVAQLCAFTSGPARPSLESGKAWIRDVRERAGPELIKGVERWNIALFGELTSVALEAGPPYRVEQLLRQVRAMRPALLWQRLIGAESPGTRSMFPRGTFDRAIAGDSLARTEIAEKVGHDAATRQTLDRLFATAPALIQAELAALLDAWAKRVFPAYAEAALVLVARDLEHKERLLGSVGPREALRAYTSGVDLEPDPASTEIVVIPTVAMRPFIVPAEWRSSTLILCSVGDEAFDDDPAAPPRRLVKAAIALGDELRLRALHELRGGELTASELAERLGVDRTSLHHHLGILRSAGLVTVRANGAESWHYSARADGIAGATSALTGYLDPRGR